MYRDSNKSYKKDVLGQQVKSQKQLSLSSDRFVEAANTGEQDWIEQNDLTIVIRQVNYNLDSE